MDGRNSPNPISPLFRSFASPAAAADVDFSRRARIIQFRAYVCVVYLART